MNRLIVAALAAPFVAIAVGCICAFAYLAGVDCMEPIARVYFSFK